MTNRNHGLARGGRARIDFQEGAGPAGGQSVRRRLLQGSSIATVALVSGLWASQAIAQTATPPTPSSGVETVTVTAEKREQNLEHVSDAITALSSQLRDLAGITSIQDISDFTPGLSYETDNGRTYIRGIGILSNNLATDSGVAVYVDGVYFGANSATMLQESSLFVDRVEVLRGPQTTIYGHSADGGAIEYTSQRPTDTQEEELRTGLDSYDKYFIEGVASGPLTDGIRYRVGFNYTDQSGGYFKNLTGSPEGGSVAQGGNGSSDHLELQLDNGTGNKLDWWAKVASSDFNVTWHTNVLLGPYGQMEYDGGSLSPEGLFGLCALPGGSTGVGCTGNPSTIVPGSVVTLPGTTVANPALSNKFNFEADFPSESHQSQSVILATTLTYHLSGVDVRYTGGYQSFAYTLIGPNTGLANFGVPVESYALEGPSVANPVCTALFPGNVAGCTQPLTINTTHSNFTFDGTQQYFSNEVTFSSTDSGSLQWIAGLYEYHSHFDQPVTEAEPDQTQILTPYYENFSSPLTLTPAPANPQNLEYSAYSNMQQNSYAGYAQADWQMTDTLKLTGGLRYSYDQKSGWERVRLVAFDLPLGPPDVTEATFGANTPAIDISQGRLGPAQPGTSAGFMAPGGGVERFLGASWSAPTGTLGLSWQPDPDTLAYAKFDRGYKTGGFNAGRVAADPETKAEYVDSYQVGLKKLFGDEFQANFDAFLYNYRDAQAPLQEEPAGGGPQEFVIVNLQQVRDYGAELETVWRPLPALSLLANYSYLNDTVSNTGGECFQDPNDPDAIEPGANTAGCPVGYQSLKGEDMPLTPHHRITLNGQYTVQFDPGYLVLSSTFTWKSAAFGDFFQRSYNALAAYSRTNLRATWTGRDDRYSIILYCDNVFNTFGNDTSGGTLITNPGPGQIVDKYLGVQPPRTFGVQLQYRFN